MDTRNLLNAGVVAGPIFVVVVAGQVLTRDGFDLTHHPISLLSLGSMGWIQILNFILAGVLSCAFALGLSRALRAGTARVWGPRLMGLFGLGLIAGGVFVPDPGLGFPPGTPDTIPSHLTWHGLLHAVAPPLAFTALVAAVLIFSRRFQVEGRRTWALYSAINGVVVLLVASWPDMDSISWRLAISIVLGFAWVTALALHERSALPGPALPVERLVDERSAS